MLNFRKVVAVGFLLAVLAVPNFSGVSATSSAADYAYLTPEVRLSLLVKLLEQLAQLQAQLKLIQAQEAEEQAVSEVESAPAKVTILDYTKGSADAGIKIVTFIGLDDPFSRRFHSALDIIVKNNSNVSATYRHFPLEQVHPNSKKLAIASECVGRLAGDTAFWNFNTDLFAPYGNYDQIDMSKLPAFAAKAGISNAAFSACRQSPEAVIAVENDIADGLQAGVQGTPTSYVFKNGKMSSTINGAQPLSEVEKILANLQR